MDNLLYAIICSPFSFIATILNIFFLFCLCWPAAGVNLCQPLRFLLIAVLCNSTLQQCIIALSIALGFFTAPGWILEIAKALTYQTFCGNFASNAWISIFYYLKIVPQKNAFAIWIKRNIKVLSYCGYFLEQFFLLIGICLGTTPYVLPYVLPINTLNATNLDGTLVTSENVTSILFEIGTKMFLVYGAFPICALSISWGRTFIYLRGHLKRMEESTSSFSSPQHQNQMRVVVMGIVQTALFIPSTLWSLVIDLLYSSSEYTNLDGNKHITMTITSISGLGNIVCLGVSQSVFRVRVIAMLNIFRKAGRLSDHTEDLKT